MPRASDLASSGDVPRIETRRLVLRAFDERDAPSVTFYADPDVMRYIPRGHWGRDDVERKFAKMVEVGRERWGQDGFGMWGIVFKDTGAVIGHCGLQRLEGGDEVEVYYLLDKPYWNRGIATEAASAVLGFGARRGLTKIVAVAFPDNRASQRVMEKIGMTFAGRAHHYGAELVKYVLPASETAGTESNPDAGNEPA